MKNKFGIVGLATGLVLAGAVAASAATVSVLANAPASWDAIDDTATTTLSAGASWATAPSIVSGSVAGEYKSPFDPAGSGAPAGSELANWQQLDYFTVGSPNLQSSPAVLTLTHSKSILSLLWGSVDTYNAIELYSGEVLLDTVSGQDVFNNGGTPAASGAALVKISGAGLFDEVRFFSNFGSQSGTDTPAFEFSNVVTAVPLPAGGLLLITALGGLGIAARRRRKAA